MQNHIVRKVGDNRQAGVFRKNFWQNQIEVTPANGQRQAGIFPKRAFMIGARKNRKIDVINAGRPLYEICLGTYLDNSTGCITVLRTEASRRKFHILNQRRGKHRVLTDTVVNKRNLKIIDIVFAVTRGRSTNHNLTTKGLPLDTWHQFCDLTGIPARGHPTCFLDGNDLFGYSRPFFSLNNDGVIPAK